jgi:lipid-A-disaccharide synthase
VTRVLVSCGEASGDLLAAGVVQALRARSRDVQVQGLVGARCREVGVEALWDVAELSVMGIAEVLPKLRRILRLMDEMVVWAARERPEVALLVDAPDFNLRLAKRLKKLGIRVVYYVSPSVWAWRSGRARLLRRDVDELCCILPFEEAWHRARSVPARFVGHPLLEQDPPREHVASLRAALLSGGQGPLLALLPGSRRFEVTNLLPAMLGAAKRLAAELPSLEVALPLAPTVPRELVDRIGADAGFAPKVVEGRARELLQASDAALVASGTATLEAALARVPTVVAYRASLLTELVFNLFVRAPFIALPNILAGREVVPELIQRAVRAEVLAERVRPLLSDTPERSRMVEGLTAVRASLGSPGASARVAEIVLARALGGPAEAALEA